MQDPTLTKNFDAAGAIAAYRIVALSANDGEIAQASATTDALVGVSTIVAAEDGQRVDAHLAGIAPVEYGGNVSRGDLLTSDADGKAVTASPASGANARIVGVALFDGADGDIGSLLITPSEIQGE